MTRSTITSARPARAASKSGRMSRLLAILFTATLVAAGCGSSDESDEGSAGSGTAAAEPVTITVMAAASLTDTFTEIAETFEDENEGVTVQLSFAGSSTLVEQIQSGAPAEVFASADTKNMDKLGAEAVDPQDFASNTLEIAVPPDNPAHVESFQDLAKADLKLVICAPEVPCGTATQKVIDATGVTLSPVSYEQSVTDVLGKVTSGEADAGVVYKTDVAGAGDQVAGIEFSEAENAVNTYPIAEIAGSENAATAKKFIEFVLSDAGQKVLADAGFSKP